MYFFVQDIVLKKILRCVKFVIINTCKLPHMDKKKSTFYLRKVTEFFFYTCVNSCQITPPPLELTMIILIAI